MKALRRYALITVVLLSSAIYFMIDLNASQIVSIFNAEQNAVLQGMAETGLKLYFLACPFIGYNIINATCFTSCENTRPAEMISVMRGVVVLVPMAFLLSAVWGMQGVWCAYPATECLVSIVGTCFYLRGRESNLKIKKAASVQLNSDQMRL